jgi:hypothetical protein
LPSPRPLTSRGMVMPAEVRALASHSLIHLEEPWRAAPTWEEWFASAGVALPSKNRGLLINDYVSVIQAALNGQGIALGWRHLIDPMLAEGRLTQITQWATCAPVPHFMSSGRKDRPLSANADRRCGIGWWDMTHLSKPRKSCPALPLLNHCALGSRASRGAVAAMFDTLLSFVLYPVSFLTVPNSQYFLPTYIASAALRRCPPDARQAPRFQSCADQAHRVAVATDAACVDQSWM